jgi:hypothetical protein
MTDIYMNGTSRHSGYPYGADDPCGRLYSTDDPTATGTPQYRVVLAEEEEEEEGLREFGYSLKKTSQHLDHVQDSSQK